MFPRTVVVLVAALSILQVARGAETEDDAPPNAKTLEAQMEAFAAYRAQQKKAFFHNAWDQLEKTIHQSGNAGNFVLGCMMKTRFGDVKNGATDGAKWKKDNQRLFSNHDVDSAAALHLQYLAMTLERAGEESSEPMQAKVWDYLAQLYKSVDLVADARPDKRKVKFSIYDEKEKKTNEMVGNMQNLEAPVADNPRSYVDELLTGSVTTGWVAKSMELDGHLAALDDWETVPGSFSGILEKDIRPYLRKKKDPKLIATWDYEKSFLALVASKSLDKKVLTKFEQEDTPRLLWKKADDIEKLGMPNRALQLRISLAKNFPNHPDFEEWTQTILANLKAIKNASPKDENALEEKAPAATAPAN